MHNDHDTHHRTLGFLYTTMGIAMASGLDHMVMAGLYLVLGLSCLALCRE